MKPTRPGHVIVTFASLALFASGIVAAPLGTAFTYQGRLAVGTNVATGKYDFSFNLYDSVSGGSPVVAGQTNAAVAVSNGFFTVTMDFGSSAFIGNARWLEIGVRTNGGLSFTPLNPRQELTPTPYAIASSTLSGTLPTTQLRGTIPAAQLGGVYSSQVTFNNLNNSFMGNGTALSGVNAATLEGFGASSFWQLGGNAGTTAGVNFLGTTDNQPLEFKVNGNRTLRLDVNGNIVGGNSANNITTNALYSVITGGSNNVIQTTVRNSTIGGGIGNTIQTNADVAVIGGGDHNTIQTDADATTISGGAMNTIQTYTDYATISGGYSNTVGANSAVISGGSHNAIQTNALNSTVGGGRYNTIQIYADVAVIGGGEKNTIQTDADATAISGGSMNTIQTNADYSTIGGGYTNVISANSSTISGGRFNTIQTNANSSTIAGGYLNTIQTNSYYSSISGGAANSIRSNAYSSTVGGGQNNSILANAHHATIPGGSNNVATGSFSFAAGKNAGALHDGVFVWSDSTAGGINSGAANQFIVRASGGAWLYSDSGVTVGAYLPAGGNAFSPMSDRNVKENFQPVSVREILEKVSQLPVTEWNLKTQPATTRHIGPMAQDFHAAFGVGEDDHHISTTDADGVALAAIKGLSEIAKEKDAQIQALEKDMADLKSIVQSLLKKNSGGGQ
jgi:hypothetical protein